MICPICQGQTITSKDGTRGYCQVHVSFNAEYMSKSHYEHFPQSENVKSFQAELLIIPPFQIFRLEDGRLEIDQIVLEKSNSHSGYITVYYIVLQKTDSKPEEVMQYYNRFKALVPFA